MKFASRAWILVFVFSGGFLCKAVLYSLSSYEVKPAITICYLKKNREDSKNHESSSEKVAIVKTSKSKRRAQKAPLSKLINTEQLEPTILILVGLLQTPNIQIPHSLAVKPPLQPPC